MFNQYIYFLSYIQEISSKDGEQRGGVQGSKNIIHDPTDQGNLKDVVTLNYNVTFTLNSDSKNNCLCHF